MTGDHSGEGHVSSCVILGGPPFEPEANQTSIQMFDAIAKKGPVLYVCRRFQGSAIRRIFKGALGKTTTTLKPGLRPVGQHGFVLVLPKIVDFLPLISPELSRNMALKITRHSINRALTKLGWSQPTLISYWWMFPEIVRMTHWHSRIFDVIDKHWGYAYEVNPAARQRSLDLTVDTARASDKIYAVSNALADELHGHMINAQVLPNAIDLDRVDRASTGLDRGRRNLAVYAGGWNNRLDIDLMHNLITRNPSWDFAFLGAAPDKRFNDYSNIEFFGDVSYEVVLKVLYRAKLGLIPFVVNEFTEASSFLKVLDYLACGVRVGATNLTSLSQWSQNYPNHFMVCPELEDWDRLFAIAELDFLGDDPRPSAPDMSAHSTVMRADALAFND